MSLTQLIQVIWARKQMFLVICCLIVTAVLVASLTLPKKYVAEAAVVVDANAPDPITNTANASSQLQPTFLATQMDVIASRNVALKVIDARKLLDDPYYKEKFAASDMPNAPMQDWLSDALLDKLSVRSSHNGNVIYLQYSSSDPVRAAAIVNAFAEAYIRTSLELKVDPMRGQVGSFGKQADELRTTLEDAQQKLSAYQAQHGLIGTDDARIDVENGRLQELSNQLVVAQSAMYASNARSQQMDEAAAQQRPDELSDLFKNPLLQSLKTELARAESKFADVSQRFDHNHPQYMSAAAELAAMQKKVATEIQNARVTITREANISRQQAASLQHAMEQQRARILSLKSEQDDYAVLKREVDNARTAYDAALQRSGQIRLQSQLDHINIAILNRAVVPLLPASPRLMINMVLALLLAPLLAMAICMGVETFRPRVHNRADLFGNSFGPVLAEIPPDTFRARRASGRFAS